jgi:hypothetical protein
MSNYWKRKADQMFGPMPKNDEEDFRISYDTAKYSVERLQAGDKPESAIGYLADIEDYLGNDQGRERRLARLGISEDQLTQLKDLHKFV